MRKGLPYLVNSGQIFLSNKNKQTNIYLGVGEMAYQLRTLKSQVRVQAPTQQHVKICNLSFKESNTLFLPPRAPGTNVILKTYN